MYKNTLGTVKSRIQQAENPTPAMVISVEAVHVDHGILIDSVTSEVVIERPEIRSPDSNIPIATNCTDDQLHLGMPGGSGDHEDEGDESNQRHASLGLNSRGFTLGPVMSTCMMATMAIIWMQMMRKMHR